MTYRPRYVNERATSRPPPCSHPPRTSSNERLDVLRNLALSVTTDELDDDTFQLVRTLIEAIFLHAEARRWANAS